MASRTVLVSGIGIGGPTLAYWLARGGFRPTLVERTPALRTGGYVIDFWGLGYDIAERMGLAGELQRGGYHVQEMRVVDDRGRRVAGFGTKVFRELAGDRFVTLARSELSRLLFDRSAAEAEVMFGDEVVALGDGPSGVDVTLRHGGRRRFDLVIGADGLHSAVRRLAFAPDAWREKQLGYTVAAFEARGYRPRDEDRYVMYNQPGRMVGRFALHDDRTLFLFVFETGVSDPPAALDLPAQKAIVRKAYAAGQWECPRILDELDRTRDLYVDRVSQIKMTSWSRGRIGLVGDAAFCVSLAAGQGSALAMTAAYVLAGELARADGRHDEAFAAYEKRLRAYIESKQRGAERFSTALAPRTRTGLFVRNQVIRAAAIPGLARLTFGADIIDRLDLPDYPWAGAAVKCAMPNGASVAG
jgi:2-polyprenyl-6-methoxyphenol hydroxylase-like FAD-dependent oxidoreductase